MFRDQIEQIDRLLTLPQIITQINEVIESEKAGASDLQRVIKADPVLSTKILQLVNSAYYGLPGRVGSLEKAVVLLGMTAVKNLAIAASVEQMFDRLHLPGPLTGRDMWRHCLAVATAARELAQRASMVYLEEVFMAGLIHDLGLLAAAQSVPQDVAKLVETAMSSKASWAAAELEILGMSHATAGAHLARKWHFPGYLVDMIADHHAWPDKPVSSDLAGVVYLADTLACRLGDGLALTAQHQSIDPEMLGRLNLAEADITDVWNNLPAYVEELSGILRV
ncbi:MAG: HDOD domain-containing protein [Planctomycetes bacterium]|nr:HDOD domain-containing protein [Planctomycetota bacterium]